MDQHYSDQPFLPNEVLSATWQHVTDGCGSTAYKSVTIDQGGLDNVEDLYRVRVEVMVNNGGYATYSRWFDNPYSNDLSVDGA